MKRINQAVLILAILTMPFLCFANNLESLLAGQIGVEKLTGRGGDYENEFSGWVGSLRFDTQEKIIYIAEFSKIDNEITVVIGIYKITKFEQYEKNINFECIDYNPGTAGIEWTGKIWLTDSNEIKIEMIQKQSPRKWVNIGKFGKEFLKKNKLNLNLGI